MKIEIKHKTTAIVLFSIEAESIKLALKAAIEARADLSGADLNGADLNGAKIWPGWRIVKED